eukprot:gb/GEZN01002061.1/.p1 GENE.gb/GEZN01002061.1/~~gb/GEZN01002061.1/.p1  ORF type:complete len:702 (-),score=97.14 gb/GEZN01002061.1/:462-2567(-)
MLGTASRGDNDKTQSLLAGTPSEVSSSPLEWRDRDPTSPATYGAGVASMQPWSALGEESADGFDGPSSVSNDAENQIADAMNRPSMPSTLKTPLLDNSYGSKSSTRMESQEVTPPTSANTSTTQTSGMPTSFTFPVSFPAARSLHQELQQAQAKAPGAGSWSPPVSIAGDEAWVIADEWGEEGNEAEVQEVVAPRFPGGQDTLKKTTESYEPVPWYRSGFAYAIVSFLGFVATIVLGTLQLGMDVKSVTMIVTFFATQVALIQPSSMPFLAMVGRPWSMLAGACFMILLSDLSSEEAFVVIDLNTLALLFGASLISANLEACQIQRQLIDGLMKDSADKVVIKLSIIAACMSLVITNDGSSLIVSPVALKLLQKRPELPKLPIMLAVSSSANLGSSLFLSGNPQNILVDNFSSSSGLTFSSYMMWACVPTLICMVVNILLLLFLLKNAYPFLCCCVKPPSTATGTPLLEGEKESSDVGLVAAQSMHEEFTETQSVSLARYRYLLIIASVVMIAIFFIPQIDVEIGWVTTATAILVTGMYPMFTNKNAAELLALVDYELLLMFTGLFVVTGGMTATGVLDKVWEAVVPEDPFNPEHLIDQGVFTAFVTILSNSVGNVPAVLLLQNAMGNSTNPKMSWQLLAWISTVAGNFTLLGSAANVIVAAAAQKAGVILTYSGYLKFGVFSTLIALAIGLVWTNLVLAF